MASGSVSRVRRLRAGGAPGEDLLEIARTIVKDGPDLGQLLCNLCVGYACLQVCVYAALCVCVLAVLCALCYQCVTIMWLCSWPAPLQPACLIEMLVFV